MEVLIVCLTVIFITVLICFKGIKINYNKRMSVEEPKTPPPVYNIKDEEKPRELSIEEQEGLLNNDNNPMGSVLTMIQEVFGPEKNNGGRK